uniref:Ig-like domain-containing protein n=1 Tax=Anas zonorhyncha TaxID=75864 RepID=A0A8B9VAG4_9AVES
DPISATRPTAYPLVPVTDCKDGSNVTIGCLVTDFFPEPVTVTWVSGVTGDQLTFPAVQNGGSYYTVSSQLTVPASSYDGQNFQCKVTHSYLGFGWFWSTPSWVGLDLGLP